MNSVPEIIEYDFINQGVAMTALHDERIARGLSLGDMEERGGVSVTAFYAWKSGLRSPQLSNLVALATTIGFDILMISKSDPSLTFDLSNTRDAINALDKVRRDKQILMKTFKQTTTVSSNSFYTWIGQKRDPTLRSLVSFADALGFAIVARRRNQRNKF